jgi:hypothetical protein
LASTLVLGCMVMAEILQRGVVAYRQHAPTNARLVFEDALRAQTLLMIAVPPAAAGGLVAVIGVSILGEQTTSPNLATLLPAIQWIVLATYLGIAVMQRLLHLDRRYQRRLWATYDRS